MNWIETEDGYVNLTTAQRIATNIRGEHSVVDPGGECHKLAAFAEELLAPVVPGSGVLHRIHYNPPGTGEPETLVETYPVVAWRVTFDGALPIVPGMLPTELRTMSSYSMTVIEMPDGPAEVHGEGRYESVALARKDLVARGQKALGKC